MALKEEELRRYQRQIVLEEIGEAGQELLKRARVLVVGAGGLGSPVLLYLAAAGVGHIGVVDPDIVSVSNLQRQILYDTDILGKSKVLGARERLSRLNPLVNFSIYQEALSDENGVEIISEYDIVVDATDNLKVRYLMDRICGEQQKPLVYGSVCEFHGQLSVFHYRGGPTYRMLFEEPANMESFRQSPGVIGALPGVIGSLQAMEVIKVILDLPDVLSGKLLLVDLLSLQFTTIRIM